MGEALTLGTQTVTQIQLPSLSSLDYSWPGHHLEFWSHTWTWNEASSPSQFRVTESRLYIYIFFFLISVPFHIVFSLEVASFKALKSGATEIFSPAEM